MGSSFCVHVLVVAGCANARYRCVNFNGDALPCAELNRARRFNSDEMRRLRSSSYKTIRKAMTESGLFGRGATAWWDVGHACPDPNKKSFSDAEDFGWNLFAQEHADNVRLGHCLVSCDEARHFGAEHVPCTNETGCRECTQEYPEL